MVRLYGVHHGGFKYSGDLFAGGLFVEPSRELIEDLCKLPPHTKVGIENFSEFYEDYYLSNGPINVDGEELEFERSGHNYWNELLRKIRKQGLDLIFLDDLETMKENTRKLLELNRKHDLLFKLTNDEEVGQIDLFPQLVNEEIKSLKRDLYKLNIEAEYLHAVAREERILENILKHKPEVVIVGSGHSDVFISKRDELERRGLIFESYCKEEIPPDKPFISFEPEFIDPIFVRNALPDDSILAERDVLLRRYKAIKLMRIFPERTPQFLGTWDIEIPEGGLFEFYIQENNNGKIKGAIEDVIGFAEFEGSLKNGAISFNKSYNYLAKEMGGAEIPIEYVATLVNGRYEGLYMIRNEGRGYQKKFWMKKL